MNWIKRLLFPQDYRAEKFFKDMEAGLYDEKNFLKTWRYADERLNVPHKREYTIRKKLDVFEVFYDDGPHASFVDCVTRDENEAYEIIESRKKGPIIPNKEAFEGGYKHGYIRVVGGWQSVQSGAAPMGGTLYDKHIFKTESEVIEHCKILNSNEYECRPFRNCVNMW